MQVVLSILVVTYNSGQFVGGCLESLRANPPSCPFEVIVADNDSVDGTTGVVRAGYPEVRLIETGANLGFAGGNRVAAAEARGELLLLLNPDTTVLPGAIDGLTAGLSGQDGAWVAGACLLTRGLAPNTSWGDFPTVGWAVAELAPWRRLGIPIRSRRIVGRNCEGIAAPRDVDWVSGAAFLVRRDAWERLGGLDTGYFMYFEETDFCARVHRAGGRVVLVPSARIVHLEGASVGQSSLRQQVWFHRGLSRFLARNNGPLAACGVRTWTLSVNTLLYLASLVAGPFSRRVRGERPRYAALIRVSLGMRVPAVDGRPVK